MMHNLNGTDGSVTIIGAVSPQGGDFSEPVTQNTKRFVRCFWGLDKSLAYSRHFPAIHWLTSYSEYLTDLSHWYQDNVSPKFVDYRNRLMALLNQESSLLEIVKLIGSDVLPDDQKLVLEIARVIRLGFLQQKRISQGRYLRLHGEAVPDDGYHPLPVQAGKGSGHHGASHVRPEIREHLRPRHRHQVRCAQMTGPNCSPSTTATSTHSISACWRKTHKEDRNYVNRIFRLKQHQRTSDRP